MTLPHRIRSQDGLTLPEVLVVILIVGALAATSYTVFLGRDKSALDADAKANARNLLAKVHACFTAREDYTLCDEPTEQEPPPGLVWGSAPGEAEVVVGAPDTMRYRVTVRAHSRATTDGTNHSFTIVKELGEREARTCESDGAENRGGGCRAGAW